MGIRRCRINKKQQLRLVECFILEVTARSAADVLGIQAGKWPCYIKWLSPRYAGPFQSFDVSLCYEANSARPSLKSQTCFEYAAAFGDDRRGARSSGVHRKCHNTTLPRYR